MENKKHTKTEMTVIREQIPASYARCFQNDCPKADSCAHFLAGKYTPEETTIGPAVYPTARKGDTCVRFKQTRVIHAAYGFKPLFAEVKKKDDGILRSRIMKYLGGNGTYYRYNSGERLLTPEQQEWIIALFRKYGYTEELRFDAYRDIIDFSMN